jgi:peptide/nickel transport system ATP-binding protein
MEKLLEISHLTKVFSLGSITSRIKITAADDVSFYIKPAEIFTLAGESGCGKTTTAKMVLGFEEPTSGAKCGSRRRGPPEDETGIGSGWKRSRGSLWRPL